MNSRTHELTNSRTHELVHSRTHTLTHSLAHSVTQSETRWSIVIAIYELEEFERFNWISLSDLIGSVRAIRLAAQLYSRAPRRRPAARLHRRHGARRDQAVAGGTA
eukprot:3242053-Pyramimonas_sp.AAC.1